MPDRFADRSADHPSEDELHAQVADRAQRSASGIGAAVIRASRAGEDHVWECVVGDGQRWHFIRVVGVRLGAFPSVVPEDIEQGIEQFAATLPASDRLHALLNHSPLHIDGSGNVTR
jgi:hypothetical protein